MLEKNKQVLLFNFGEDLTYFVILRYKLRDFCDSSIQIKWSNKKGFSEDEFQKSLLLF